MSDGDYQPLSREALETFAQGARDVARATRTQFEAYVEMGFSDSQALTLTLNWQTNVMRGGDE